MNVENPYWFVDSQLQGHKLKASLILAYHQCGIITVSTLYKRIQPKNMTFLGSAYRVLLLVVDCRTICV